MAVPPGRLGRTCGLPSPHAHHRLKPMKHDLTLDHVKIEARDLLRGLQGRDPEAFRRRHAVEPFTDLSNPALDCARFIIVREHVQRNESLAVNGGGYLYAPSTSAKS